MMGAKNPEPNSDSQNGEGFQAWQLHYDDDETGC